MRLKSAVQSMLSAFGAELALSAMAKNLQAICNNLKIEFYLD